MAYADIEYCGEIYHDAELLNRKWYFEQRHGEVYAFTFQRFVKPINTPQTEPRHRKLTRSGVRLFGVMEARSSTE